MATSLKDPSALTMTPLHPAHGAEVSGVDLGKPLESATVEAIRHAWHDNAVLLFRGQDISGDDQLRFAEHFGTVAERHQPKAGATKVDSADWTNLMMVTDIKGEDGKPIGGLGHGEMWFHSDKCQSWS